MSHPAPVGDRPGSRFADILDGEGTWREDQVVLDAERSVGEGEGVGLRQATPL